MARSSEYNGDQLVTVVKVFLSLTYVSVLLRCYVRIRITKAFQLDDWFMVISQAVFSLSCAFILIGIHYGIGRHNAALSLENQTEALKYQAFAVLSYIANMMFIKISIAIFLLRIAVKRPYVWILRISIWAVVTCSIAVFIFDLLQCIPIAAQWDLTIKNPKCVSAQSFAAAAYAISAMTIVTDWLYALLPIPMIWKAQMSCQKKATVAFILSLGIFASVATLIRLRYIMQISIVTDVLFTGTDAMFWTLVEPGVAITAASLVTIRPLLRSLNVAGFESNDSYGSFYTPTQNTHLSIHNDVPADTWAASTISSVGAAELSEVDSRGRLESLKDSCSGMTLVTEKTRDIESLKGWEADAEKQEYILEGGGKDVGIRRPDNVKVVRSKAGSPGRAW